MILRTGAVLLLTVLGTISIGIGVDVIYGRGWSLVAFGAGWLVLAGVYGYLTAPRRLL